MTSFQISITPSRRAASRFVAGVRRAVLKAYAEEQAKSGISQTDLARTIGVHRSVVNRELRGQRDMTLGRVAELAFALGRKATISFDHVVADHDSNIAPSPASAPPKSDVESAGKEISLAPPPPLSKAA